MRILLRNSVAIIVALVVGGALNMAIVMIGPSVIAPPKGVDVTDAQSWRASIDVFEAKHFVPPPFSHMPLERSSQLCWLTYLR